MQKAKARWQTLDQLRTQAHTLLSELYDQPPETNAKYAALKALRSNDVITLNTITKVETELERLKAEKVLSDRR